VSKSKAHDDCAGVERLESDLALRAKLANLLHVVAGVQVSLDNAEVDITGVEAETSARVRLENLHNIVDRALKTLDGKPKSERVLGD
jgi:hypothetical protein